MQPRHILVVTAVISTLAAAGAFVLRAVTPAPDVVASAVAAPTLDLGELASLPADAVFPRPAAGPIAVQDDMASHRDVRSEAWLLNASLALGDGTQADLSMTIARLGLVAVTDAGQSPSQWQARGGWVSSVALRPSGEAGRLPLHEAQRLTRDMALLKVSADAAVELPGLRLTARPDGLELVSDDDTTRLSLAFSFNKPALGPGDTASPLRAFSLTRLQATGTLEDLASGAVEALAGTAWLDRAWGELPLPGGATVNERYVVQLDTGSELIVSRSWRRGSTRRRVSAQLVDVDGNTTSVGPIEANASDGALAVESSNGTVKGTLLLRERGGASLGVAGGQAVNISFAGTVAGERVTGTGFGRRAPQ